MSGSVDAIESGVSVMWKAFGLGIVWGVFCGVANGRPIASTLAQMAVPWVWVAALVAHRTAASRRHAAVLGGVTLLAANLAYFAVASVNRGLAGLPLGGGLRFVVLWSAVGLVIGPVAGVLGCWLAVERMAPFAAATLATISIAEPLALWAHIDHLDAHAAYTAVAAVGLVFPFLWLRRLGRSGSATTVVVVALVYPTAIVLEAVLIALRQISAPMRLV